MAVNLEANEPVIAERRGLQRGLYLLPSLFTAANIGMGFFAAMETLRSFQFAGQNDAAGFALAAEHFNHAATAIGLAILFDMLDGRIARWTKTTSEIGMQLDSIADVLTFGIAPALLVYAWSYGTVFTEETPASKLGWFVSFMFLICGAFRLARFNVRAIRKSASVEENGAAKEDHNDFVGLPIPPAAGLMAAIIHFAPTPFAAFDADKAVFMSGAVMFLMAMLSFLMVSLLRYPSFKSISLTRRSTMIVIISLAATGMLILLFSRVVLLILAVAYVSSGFFYYLRKKLHRRPQISA